MATLSEAQDDSSNANPSSVKSEDGSPHHDGDRASPPPNCAICLGRCRNKSFTDSCLHQFCFKCLVTWSKVKSECPLCKQNFKSIIHNVQSNQQYEEYRVDQRRFEEERERNVLDDLVTATRRFRYRTTLTIPRGGEHLALQRLLMHYPLSTMVEMTRDLPRLTPAALPASRRRRSPSSFRRTVYRHNLWARPLPDFTGRHRDCTPIFYRYNDTQMHRLVPWLHRELHYLLLENTGHITYVLQRIIELLPQYHITSQEFRDEMYRYFGARTDHFLHELHCFASTPYDLTGYDRNVQYTTDSRVSNTTVNDILTSSDTESGDSDIVLVTETPAFQPFRPVTPAASTPFEGAGPSARRPPDPVYPQNHITSPAEAARLARTVIPIETISHSDTDDDEVMVTGYIKPPHQRTPEVVDLRDSDDSDVVVTEGPVPASSRDPRGFVKLTLSRPRSALSELEEGELTPPAPRARRLLSDSTYSPQSSRSSSPRSPSPRSADEDEERLSGDTESATTAEVRGSRGGRCRRRRARRGAPAEREELAASTSSAAADTEGASRENRRKKSKSSNGKGVKSSSRGDTTTSIESSRAESAVREEPQPGPSSQPGKVKSPTSKKDDRTGDLRTTEPTGQEESRPGPSRPEKPGKSSRKDDVASESKKAEPALDIQVDPQPGPSRPAAKGKSRKDESESHKTESTAEARPSQSRPGTSSASGGQKRKNTEEIPSRRNSRENKRLKSVVKKTSSWSANGQSTSSAIRLSSSSAVRASNSAVSTSSSAVSSSSKAQKSNSSDFTDSDDDIPLNLTIQRPACLP